MLLYLLLRSVLVRHVRYQLKSRYDSATFVAAVARSLDARRDDFLRHLFGVLGQSEEAHGVYEGGGDVQLAAKLTGGVVEGECVVVVVEAFP